MFKINKSSQHLPHFHTIIECFSRIGSFKKPILFFYQKEYQQIASLFFFNQMIASLTISLSNDCFFFVKKTTDCLLNNEFIRYLFLSNSYYVRRYKG